MPVPTPSHSHHIDGPLSMVPPNRGSLVVDSSLHPPFSSQRYSMNPTRNRKPLRSSPLAGPALQLDSSIPEVKEEDENRSNRISSTPNLLSLLPPPAQLARPKSAETPCQSRFILSPSTTSLSLKKSFTSVFSSGSIKQETTHKSEQPRCARQPKSADGRAQNVKIYNSAQVPEHPLPKAHDPTNNSWLTSNTYEVTPKFTRLGLGSSNVVLPVSVKQHKRQSYSQQNLTTSFKAATTRLYRNDNNNPPNPSTSLSPTNFPRDSLSYPINRSPTSSFTSSSESLDSSYARGSSASSVTTSSNITTIAEGDETNEYRYEESPIDTSNDVTHPPNGPLARIRSLPGLRSIRSFGNDVRSQSLTGLKPAAAQADTPIQEKMVVDTVETHQELGIGIIISKFDLNAITTTVIGQGEQAKGTNFETTAKLKTRRTSVKKLWGSISKWQQSR